MRWPSTSSSSQLRSRGQARASDSWAISTDVVVAGHQPGSHQELDEPFVFGVGGDGAAWDAAANRFAVREWA